jgi:hypothetical protein
MADYERNVLYRSPLTGEFWFAPKVRVLNETVRRVVGSKYNVTEALQPYLLKKFQLEAALREGQPGAPAEHTGGGLAARRRGRHTPARF